MADVYVCIVLAGLAIAGNVAAMAGTSSTTAPTRLQGTSGRFERFANYLLTQQQSIIQTLTNEDGTASFAQDPWQKLAKTDGTVEGYGITAVMQRGDLLEKAAVSTTIVTGRLTEERARTMSSRSGNPNIVVNQPYAAAALSLVLHSRSPMVPTFRSDIR